MSCCHDGVGGTARQPAGSDDWGSALVRCGDGLGALGQFCHHGLALVLAHCTPACDLVERPETTAAEAANVIDDA